MAGQSYYGQQDVPDDLSDFNVRDFHIRQRIAGVRTGVPVKIVAVHGGGLGAAPTVDVQPLINQIDGQGNQTPHGVITGIPTTRNQGGDTAIINDPVVGDVGYMMVADRDTSALRANQGAPSNPGSFRTHDLADGTYVGAMLNAATPKQGLQRTDDGLRLFDRNGNVILTSASGITVTDANGNVVTLKSGVISVNPGGGMVFLGGDGVSGTYDFVTTVSGPSINVKARIG